MNVLVSIIIPTYNRMDYLADAVQSCLAQTWGHVEMIIVDDGSTDHTSTYLASLKSSVEGKTVICLRQENAGPSAARNYGLTVAKGEFIKFLDSDDSLEPDAIAQYVEALSSTGCDMCIGARRQMSPEGRKWRPNYFPQSGQVDRPIEAFFTLELRPQGALWLFRRKQFESVSWNEALLAREDTDLLARLIIQGATVCGAPLALYNQRYHEGERQITKQFLPEVRTSICQSNREILGLLVASGASSQARRAFAGSIGRTALRLYDVDKASALAFYAIAIEAARFHTLNLVGSYPKWQRVLADVIWVALGLRASATFWRLFRRVKEKSRALAGA